MLIGAMNHPKHDPVEEIEQFAELGLEFVDLTLEPPAAASWRVEVAQLRKALERTRLPVVGHTAYYLPLASAFEEIRQGAIYEMRRCMRIFAELGANWVNVHPDRHAPMHDRPYYIERNLQSLDELIDEGKRLGVGLMVENLPGDFNTVEQLAELLDPLPDLGLHLDIGHANLLVAENTTAALVRQFPDRLKHVHLHDNRGGHADLHLPLGAGNVPVEKCLAALKEIGYDSTITLEVFCEDPHFLLYSRDQLRRLWDAR